MGTRSLRPKQTIDYSAENSGANTPAWLRSERKAGERAITGERKLDLDGIEKENETPPGEVHASRRNKKAASKGAAPKSSRSKQADVTSSAVAKVQDTAGSKADSSGGSKPRASRSTASNAKHPDVAEVKQTVKEAKPAAVRGRNAGLQMLEVEEVQKPKGRGGRKSSTHSAKRHVEDEQAESSDGANNRKKLKPNQPQPQAAADSLETAHAATETILRPVPGLPGVSQRAPAVVPQRGKAAAAAAAVPAAGVDHVVRAESKSAPAAKPAKAALAAKAAQQKATAKQGAAAAAAQAVQQAAAVPLPAAELLHTPENFIKVQAQYAELHRLYEELKAKRMEEVESIMEEQEKKVAAHSERAQKMADLWKKEAARQAAFAQSAGASDVKETLEKMRRDITNLNAQVLELEALGLQKDKRIAQLERQLADALRRAEPPQQAEKATQAVPAPAAATSAAMQFPTPGCATAQAGDATPVQSGVPAAPAVPERTPHFVHEAVAMVPEGADLSELYQHPDHAFSVAQPDSDSPCTAPLQSAAQDPSGLVHCNSSAKPLVPYQVGLSASHPPRKSRFADELQRAQAAGSAAEVAPEPALENQQVGTQEYLPADQGQAQQAAEAAAQCKSPVQSYQDEAPPANEGQPEETPATAAPVGEGCQAVERQLQFSLASGQAEAAAQPAVSENMSLTGSEQTNDKPTMTNKALNVLVGLAAAPVANGGFTFTHAQSGFVFQIGPSDAASSFDSDGEWDEEEEVAYKPLHLGEAVQVLPGYLQSAIQFSSSQKQMLVSRIMEALSKFKQRKRGQAGH